MYISSKYSFEVNKMKNTILVKFLLDAIPLLVPPMKITLLSCTNEGETINLSKLMSKELLIHQIYNNVVDYDNVGQESLYVLNFDCNSNNSLRFLEKVNHNEMFGTRTKWLLFGNINIQIFQNFHIYPDSDVILLDEQLEFNLIRIISVYRPSPLHAIILEERGNWTWAEGLRLENNIPASMRRRNLRGSILRSTLMLSKQNSIVDLTNQHEVEVDFISKINYPWILDLMDFMNATVYFQMTTSHSGFKYLNGSWDGTIGLLQRNEIDIGGSATYMEAERLEVVDYIQLYTRINLAFVFRKPPLSSVKNILTLPFHQDVWMVIGLFAIFVWIVLYGSIIWEYCNRSSKNVEKPTVVDGFLIVLGTLCQQGYTYQPWKISSRLVIITLQMIALNLYAAYTANIVSLLKTTTDSIKTLSDLNDSPLKLGMIDVEVFHYLAATLEDPLQRKIIQQKIEPKINGESGWMSPEKGVGKLKTELFAFYMGVGTVYRMIQNTFEEDEKCDFNEIGFLNSPKILLPIKKMCPYREILRIGGLRISEGGLRDREESQFFDKRPDCRGMRYVSIGLIECKFALLCLVYGFFFALIIFVIEILFNKCSLRLKCNSSNKIMS